MMTHDQHYTPVLRRARWLAVLAAGALLRLWTLRKAPARKDDGLRADTLDGTTLEGDFRVVSKPVLPAR